MRALPALLLLLSPLSLASECDHLLTSRGAMIGDLARLKNQIDALSAHHSGHESSVRAIRDFYDQSRLQIMRIYGIPPSELDVLLASARSTETGEAAREAREAVRRGRMESEVAFGLDETIEAPTSGRMSIAGGRVFMVSVRRKPRFLKRSTLARALGRPLSTRSDYILDLSEITFKDGTAASDEVMDIPPSEEEPRHAAFSPDGNWFAVSDRKSIRIFDLKRKSFFQEVKCPYPNSSTKIELSRDSAMLTVSLANNNRPKFFKMIGGRLQPFDLQTKEAGTSDISAVSEDGRRIATFSNSNATFWNLGTGELISSFPLNFIGPTPISPMLRFSPNGRFLVVNTMTQAVILDTDSGRSLQLSGGSIEYYSGISEFSPDEKLVLFEMRGHREENKSVSVFDTATGHFLWQLKPQDRSESTKFEFGMLPDGRVLTLDGHDFEFWRRALPEDAVSR